MILVMVFLDVMVFFIVFGIFWELYEDKSTWKRDIQEMVPHHWELETPTMPMVAVQLFWRNYWKGL